ncbi:MAG: immune inhibitor A [Candidatus Promineifilaceae bacterium]|nr:immune inhibitor A [Candidatus Promineifilaceae bacterium]
MSEAGARLPLSQILRVTDVIRKRQILAIFILLLVGLSACQRAETPTAVPTAPLTVAGATIVAASPTVAGTATAPPPATIPAAGSGGDLAQVVPVEPNWPAPAALPPTFAVQAPSVDQVDVGQRLTQARSPERDDLELARLYRGWDGQLAPVPTVKAPLREGAVQELRVLNHDRNEMQRIEVELRAVSRHAYFWFESSPQALRPRQTDLQAVSQRFDRYYEELTAFFGREARPGVDGDPRLHIVNAAPQTLCASGVGSRCGLAGYFSAADAIPTVVDPQSNAREMFVMNGSYFGTDTFYETVLIHELRHMVEDNYDRSEADWAVEGSAILAEDLLGWPGNGYSRANIFLEAPDQQLNRWTDGYTIPYYGQGYLLSRYLYDRLGPETYRRLAVSPEDGLRAVDLVAAEAGLDLTGQGVWLDWLVALAVHDRSETPAPYRLNSDQLETAAMTPVKGFPVDLTTTVHQYAADYYHLQGDETVTLDFQGSTLVPLLDTAPASAQWMWLAQRTNYSHLRLTRPVDLRAVSSATLEYSVYHDIESGYDFAYVFVSTDGGATWQPLNAPHMRQREGGDDPAGSALASHFYTGQSDGWLQERIDLTPFAGQEILLRFAYITDPILTFGGLALDNIAIPEIGWVDDVEQAQSAWLAEGFQRVTAVVPQRWHVQLVTFADSVPQVETLPLSDLQHVRTTIDLAASDEEAILIVAATAPMTLEKAHYRLQLQE